ncbi:MAG: transcription termination/antitermination protein NusG [Acidimicrobiia bacterium]
MTETTEIESEATDLETDDAPAADVAPPVDGEADEAPAEQAEEAEDTQVELQPEETSPYDRPGSWYVIHSYSGYENKVKANLETRVRSMHLEDRIFEVVIPMEPVVEIKGGRKVTVDKKMFPGYILTRLYLDDDTWYAVRNTPGVTGFVGSGTKPTPLARREVERFLGVRGKEEAKKAPEYKPEWEIGEAIQVVAGPFAEFNGVIEDINVDQSKVTVLVNIFGRDTPVVLDFGDIQKN